MKHLFTILILLLINISCTKQVEQCDCSRFEKELQSKPNLKITICHNGNTISIDEESWLDHQAHGDTLGECSTLSVDDYEYDWCKDWCRGN